MTVFVVLALLAGNIFLAKMLLSKENKKPCDAETETGKPLKEYKKANTSRATVNQPQENTIEDKIASVVGESKYDPDTYKQIVREVVKEAVPLIIEEYGNYADAGLPDTKAHKKIPQVPADQFDDVFSNKTISEVTGEDPDPAEPRADGVDFNDINTTMNVLKEKSDNAEDMAVAQRTLRELEGTTIKEQISLDPAIRKRIMLIELHLPPKEEMDSPSEKGNQPKEAVNETADKKKLLFHADIDTSDIDGIDFNVFH